MAIFCKQPPVAERKTAVTTIPEAVIEVVNEGCEAKDLVLGPAFYLMHGVKDVVILDPATGVVLHLRKCVARAPTVACGHARRRVQYTLRKTCSRTRR